MDEMDKVTIRRLSRETNRVVEQAVRTGKPVIVTVYGRPAVAVVPLQGRVEDLPSLGLEGAPEHVLDAFREAQADIVAGKLLPGDEPEEVAKQYYEQVLAMAHELSEKGDSFVYTFDLVGVPQHLVSVEVDENLLKLGVNAEPGSKGTKVNRTFSLPAPVAVKDATLNMDNGVLTVTLPRAHTGVRPVQLRVDEPGA